ncbi:MAG: D-alanyl-D-alanine carboxypeptidase family protein [Porcipelethomonas sp.]
MPNNKKTSMNVYQKRQMVLLIIIGSIIVAIILGMLLYVVFDGNEEISEKTAADISSSETTATAVPAGGNAESQGSNDVCFESDSITIKVGEKVTPDVLNGSIDLITDWQSSDSAVASVSGSGEISGIGAGSCEITATVKDTGRLLTLRVDVKPADEIESSEAADDSSDSDSDVNYGTARGDTSNAKYEVVEENGLTYIYGILMASKSFSLPRDYDPGVNEEALNAFYEMQSDAAAEGLDIYISSSYRSYEDQERIYNRYVEQDGQAAADTYSSRPGYSDHQTGLAFDLNTIDDSFGYTPESDWVKVNAHKYGFIIRYPEGKEDITGYQYEPWHIRYIGVEKATEVYESGLSLEEFLGVDSKYSN